MSALSLFCPSGHSKKRPPNQGTEAAATITKTFPHRQKAEISLMKRKTSKKPYKALLINIIQTMQNHIYSKTHPKAEMVRA